MRSVVSSRARPSSRTASRIILFRRAERAGFDGVEVHGALLSALPVLDTHMSAPIAWRQPNRARISSPVIAGLAPVRGPIFPDRRAPVAGAYGMDLARSGAVSPDSARVRSTISISPAGHVQRPLVPRLAARALWTGSPISTARVLAWVLAAELTTGLNARECPPMGRTSC